MGSDMRTWPRAYWFASFAAIATLNAFANRARSRTSDLEPLEIALGLFGINAIVWFGLFALFALALRSGPQEPIVPGDRYVLSISACLMLVPIPQLAGFALVLIGGWLIWTAGGQTPAHRVGVVAIALSGPALWGPLLLLGAGPDWMAFDTAIMGAVTGLTFQDNLYLSADRSVRFMVGTGCVSLANISLAILATVALSQLLEKKMDRRVALVCLISVVAVVGVNIARLASYAYFPQHFAYLHDGGGSDLFALAFTVAAVGAALTGLSRIRADA